MGNWYFMTLHKHICRMAFSCLIDWGVYAEDIKCEIFWKWTCNGYHCTLEINDRKTLTDSTEENEFG